MDDGSKITGPQGPLAEGTAMKTRRKRVTGKRPKDVQPFRRPRGGCPHWVKANKVLVAMHFLADDDGFILGSWREIAEAAKVRITSFGDTIYALRDTHVVHFDLKGWPEFFVLDDTPAGQALREYLDDDCAKICDLPRVSPGPADGPPPLPEHILRWVEWMRQA